MPQKLVKYKHLISLSIPALIAIIAVESVNVIMFAHGPLSENINFLPIWLILQALSGFVFAYISDKHFRKQTLIATQILGVLGGGVLYFIGMDKWAIVLIALIFNPLPVARAALLDNFPRISSLRLIGITFLAQFFPWFFFRVISSFEYQNVLLIILATLSLNVLFMAFLFKDIFDINKSHDVVLKKIKRRKVILLILSALILSEAVFYFMWDYIEYLPGEHFYYSPATMGTLLGISIAIIYPKLPHISIITMCYFIGFSIMIISGYIIFYGKGPPENILINSITYYSVLGGLYLPLVTDAVIELLGANHKALGSSLIEIAGTIAALSASLLDLKTTLSPFSILIMFSIFLLFAAVIQKLAEKKHRKRKSM